MTSPAVMSAMRITPSSIIRDSGAISDLLSASASDSISWSRDSGPGAMNSISFWNSVRRGASGSVVCSPPLRGRPVCGSDIARRGGELGSAELN